MPVSCLASRLQVKVASLNLYIGFRVPVGRVIFEVGGAALREEIAKQGMSPLSSGENPAHEDWIGIRVLALKMAQDKLPVKTEFITVNTAPRLGSIVSSSLTAPLSAQPIPALLAQQGTRDKSSTLGGGVVLDQGESRMESRVGGFKGLKLEQSIPSDTRVADA